jgi:hypothetical protein
MMKDGRPRSKEMGGSGLFQISAYQIDEVFGEFGSDLLFGAVDEMETNVGFENLAHKAVNSAADGGEEHQLTPAIFIGGDQALDSIELAAEAADALEQLNFLAIVQGHGQSPLAAYP